VSGSAGIGTGGGIGSAGTLIVTNSTIAGNLASDFGGGLDVNSLRAVNDTIAYNTVGDSGSGGGLAVGTATLENTIVALNTRGSGPGATADDISGTVDATDSYNNLIGAGGSGGLTTANHNQVGVADANVGLAPAPADNGGPTPTIALLPRSFAIDHGSNALAVDAQGNPLQFDQRGTGFVRVFGNSVDVGAYEFLPAGAAALSVEWGTAGAAMLQSAADGLRLLPLGRTTDLPWTGIAQLPLELGQTAALTAADVTITSAIGVNYGPVKLTGSGTSYTIILSRPITRPDRVTITISGAGPAAFTRWLDVLPGDFNDDGRVNSQDLVGVRNEWLGAFGAHPTIFGDLNGDGAVNLADYIVVRGAIGTTLPAVSSAGAAVGSAAAGPAAGGGPAVVSIGSLCRAPSGQNPASRAAPAAWRGPRAEVRLTARGRGWSLGTSLNTGGLDPALPGRF
jgi:hypothetical protein